MTALTTRQRDILHILLESNEPLGASDLADQLQITPRQVRYGLKGLTVWLAQRDITLNTIPGSGTNLICSAEKYRVLAQELTRPHQFQLVLSISQRQQLIALTLLISDEPRIIYQLQQWAQHSRSTILKDLDLVEAWLISTGLSLDRRPNFGFLVTGLEQFKRQAISALLWGETSFGEPVTQLNFANGITFDLGEDANLLPIIEQINVVIRKWDIQRTFGHVAYAESQLGGRFTDDAVLYLALILAIQTERVQTGHFITMDADIVAWLQTQDCWAAAAYMAKHLGWQLDGNWPPSEIAYIAMHILTAPRNERWPGDLESDHAFSELIDELVQTIVAAYDLPALAQDKTLHDGLIIHIVPACLRHKFRVWTPTILQAAALSTKYIFEHKLARSLAEIINQRTAVTLPESDLNNLVLLLRAAYIRKRPNQLQEVLIVCPSGMATAQLLVARLNARFPRLGTLRVISLRELSQADVRTAELIITTVPLRENMLSQTNNVIQVHPLLLPEDIEKITQWMA